VSPDYDRLARALRAVAERLGAAWPMSLWVAEGIKQAEEWMWEQEEER
jgi:hypothetical protein